MLMWTVVQTKYEATATSAGNSPPPQSIPTMPIRQIIHKDTGSISESGCQQSQNQRTTYYAQRPETRVTTSMLFILLESLRLQPNGCFYTWTAISSRAFTAECVSLPKIRF